jgi:hypothetical protein
MAPSSKLFGTGSGYRIKRAFREAAAYVKLRRLGYSISVLSHAFGRSTSMIWRILKRNGDHDDLRKIPTHTRNLAKVRQWENIQRFVSYWELWILGEGEKPP